MSEALTNLTHLRMAAERSKSLLSKIASLTAEALEEISRAKQDKLEGNPGQVVGFDGSGAAAVQSWSNPNMLVNAYLAKPINQRGKPEYTAAGWGLDMWRTWDAVTVTVSEQGTLVQNNTTKYTGIFQYMDRIPFGTPVTISVLAEGNEFVTATAVYDRKGEDENFVFDVNTSFGAIRVFDEKALDRTSFEIANAAGKPPKNVIAVKMEVGTRQTLAHLESDGTWALNDPFPDPVLELMKCQRHFQLFATEAARPTKAADFRPAMRSDPKLGTMELDGVTYYTAEAGL